LTNYENGVHLQPLNIYYFSQIRLKGIYIVNYILIK
jgi:hypothetical protein